MAVVLTLAACFLGGCAIALAVLLVADEVSGVLSRAGDRRVRQEVDVLGDALRADHLERTSRVRHHYRRSAS